MSVDFYELRAAAAEEAAAFQLPPDWEESRAQIGGNTIDPGRTQSHDDVIDYEPIPDGNIIRVGTPDVGTFLEPDSDIVALGQQMGETRRWPSVWQTHFPAEITTGVLSLRNGQPTPVATDTFSVARDGSTEYHGVTHDSATATPFSHNVFNEAILGNGTEEGVERARSLFSIALNLLEKRKEAGALAYYDPATETQISESGDVSKMTPAEFTVREFMILVNTTRGREMAVGRRPGIFRVQDPAETDKSNEEIIEIILRGNEAEIAALGLKRFRYSVTPDDHAGYNAPYANVTTPLNSFEAYVNHRNETDAEGKRTPSFDTESLEPIADHLTVVRNRMAGQPVIRAGKYGRRRAAGKPRGPEEGPPEAEIQETIDQVIRTGQTSEEFVAELNTWGHQGALKGKHLYTLLLAEHGPIERWDEVDAILREYLKNNPNYATDTLDKALGERLITDLSYADRVEAPGHITTGRMMRVTGGQEDLISVEGEGHSQKSAKHAASYKLLRNLIG